MFRTRKAKIISTPVEKVLEAEVVVSKDELVAIDFARVEGKVSYIEYGTLVDYDGKEYEFEWDTTQGKLSRLTGSKVSPFTWASATEVLNELHKAPEVITIQEVTPSIEEQIQKSLVPVVGMIKKLGDDVSKIKITPTITTVTETPKPEPVSKKPAISTEEEPVDVDEGLIMANAIKFLQESRDDDLGVDYLSL